VKTPLQQRAEALAEEFKKKGRRPVVIEFAGSPKAGKTTTLSTLQAFLKRCGFRVEVVIERASICPIRDKKHANFNIWTACTTLAQILEKTQHQHRREPDPDAPEILILDRGLFDAIVWLEMMEHLARIQREELEIVERFLLMPEWRKRIFGVVVMTASPNDSMERERGDLPVEGTQGSIMNEKWLAKFRKTILSVSRRLEGQFRIFHVDTSDKETRGHRAKTAEKVARIMLDIITDQLEESILCALRAQVAELFSGKNCVTGAQALSVANHFVKQGSFIPRLKAESLNDYVQALPIVVVRAKNGSVLLMERREKSPANPLHGRLVVWAGGHVRKEDAANGNSLIQGALREAYEELRLSLDSESLELVGAVYSDLGGSTSKHAALVYQWNAPADDVDIVLSGTEFFERRGTSLRGKFVAVRELLEIIEKDPDKLEPWSELIVRQILSRDSVPTDLRLL
jgi:predicted NUDIX family phosphoesterase/predicted ATPase